MDEDTWSVGRLVPVVDQMPRTRQVDRLGQDQSVLFAECLA